MFMLRVNLVKMRSYYLLIIIFFVACNLFVRYLIRHLFLSLVINGDSFVLVAITN